MVFLSNKICSHLKPQFDELLVRNISSFVQRWTKNRLFSSILEISIAKVLGY
jgi:hypothetical protein